jgi:hypothetical protein
MIPPCGHDNIGMNAEKYDMKTSGITYAFMEYGFLVRFVGF